MEKVEIDLGQVLTRIDGKLDRLSSDLSDVKIKMESLATKEEVQNPSSDLTHVKIRMEGMEARMATKEDFDSNREELIETVEFDLGKALTEVNGKLNTLREDTDNLDSELQILDSSAQGLWDHLEELDNGLGKLEFIAYQRIFIAMVSLVVIQHLLRTVGLIE